MKRHTWKFVRVVLAAAGLVGALVSCNSHLLLKSGDPEVVVIDPPDVAPPEYASFDKTPLIVDTADKATFDLKIHKPAKK